MDVTDGYTTIRLERAEGGLVHLVFNRPEKRNALDLVMREELADAVERLRRDESVRCVLLRGEGRSFSAGGDVSTMGAVPDAWAGRERLRRLHAWAERLIELEKPVVAAVHGHAVGAGMSLAMAADIRVAAEGTVFGMAFVRLGLVPDLAGLYLLTHLVGPSLARELAFTGRQFEAEEALRMGLVHRVVPADRLLAEAEAVARQLAEGPSRALALIKHLSLRALELDLKGYLEHEAFAQAVVFQTDDHREGVQAFRERRPPRFTGR